LGILKLFDALNDGTIESQVNYNDNWHKLKKLLLTNCYPPRLFESWKSEHDRLVQSDESKCQLEVIDNLLFSSLKELAEKHIIDVKPDGHCLLHCICISLNIRYCKLIAILNNFYEAPSNKFKDVLLSDWKKQFREYVNQKKFDSNLVDIIPAILSDSLGIKLTIISNNDGVAFASVFNGGDFSHIVLILECGHYRVINYDNLPATLVSWIKSCQMSSFINLSNYNPQPQSNKKLTKTNYIRPTISTPFKSDIATKNIIQMKRSLKCGDEFNLVFKSTSSLISLVRKASNRRTKTTNTDETKGELDLDSTGVVYSAICKDCQTGKIKSEYIGETGRPLRARLKEHQKTINPGKDPSVISSAIGEHSVNAHGTQPNLESWMISILHTNDKTQHRRTLEALEIQRRNPTLNRDRGVNVILHGIIFD